MKKLWITALIIIQTGWVLAQTYPTIYVRHENAKFYKQPAYRAEVMGLLQLTDQVQMVRKFNDRWVIVKVNGQPGYVERWNVTKKLSRQKRKSTSNVPLIVVEKQN
ncbi:hypothetical protein [Adhaeribacter pallidiroseus]|uniref:SH3b domain-containing protein n=1 Tax=Adhaeribacter pallidiroseus TaxID=2072847 RepID=A0A369QRU0_9BACT|nr:hypothetical protein [Adhaeribacter pallidiroseus]RDC65957.1 hypothetical protein AHMF7616_04588 [Adhaeribacter pallidiroseus]